MNRVKSKSVHGRFITSGHFKIRLHPLSYHPSSLLCASSLSTAHNKHHPVNAASIHSHPYHSLSPTTPLSIFSLDFRLFTTL